MFKKLGMFVLIICVLANLTACGEEKSVDTEHGTLDNFIKIANEMNLSMIDSNTLFEGDSRFKSVYIAAEANGDKSEVLWQVEHYTMRNKKEAAVLFEEQSELVKKLFATEDVITSPDITDCKVIEIKSQSKYFYMEQINDVIILSMADIAYMSEIQLFFQKLRM